MSQLYDRRSEDDNRVTSATPQFDELRAVSAAFRQSHCASVESPLNRKASECGEASEKPATESRIHGKPAAR
ncbi:MAG TPA: hypothetical protein EYG03_22130 [Planctomycetes bacterium]|nr:hypothetical protein [Planctomycetota bacterium]